MELARIHKVHPTGDMARKTKGKRGDFKRLAGRLIALFTVLASISSSVAKDAGPAGRDALADQASDKRQEQLIASADTKLAVDIRLKSFRIIDADEDGLLSNGDEPYLLVAVILADGTTINYQNLPSATVRILSVPSTHGNLGINGGESGIYSVPLLTGNGTLLTTIKPIGGVPSDIGKQLAMVGIIVVAMDEDATPTSAMEAARKAFIKTLRAELNQSIRSLQQPNVQAITMKLQNAIIGAVKADMWSSPGGFVNGLVGIADPDDYIGSGFKILSYREIEAGGEKFVMSFKKPGVSYQLLGSIRRP